MSFNIIPVAREHQEIHVPDNNEIHQSPGPGKVDASNMGAVAAWLVIGNGWDRMIICYGKAKTFPG